MYSFSPGLADDGLSAIRLAVAFAFNPKGFFGSLFGSISSENVADIYIYI